MLWATVKQIQMSNYETLIFEKIRQDIQIAKKFW